MATYQTAREVTVAFKEQSAAGTLPTETDATGFRINSGGLNLAKEPITSNELRTDGLSTRGRHGGRSVTGSYVADLSVGTFDPLIAALFWSAFGSVLTVDDETAAMDTATLAVGANTITASAGSWIDAGLRVGDVIRATEGLAAGDLNRNIRLTGVTDLVLTTLEDLTVEAGPIAAWTITRPKKVIQGKTRKAFAFEEREIDIDGSELFEWCRISSIALEMAPNAMATLNFSIVGRNMTLEEGEDSPYFTAPEYTVTQGLTAVEAKIMLGTTEVVDLTALSLTMDRRAAGQPVVGSDLTPDVFDNSLQVTGSITGLRSDFTRTQAFLSETDLSLHVLFAENTAEPQSFIGFCIPYLTLASSSKSELGQDGPRTQTLDLLIGADPRGGAYDACMVKVQSTAT